MDNNLKLGYHTFVTSLACYSTQKIRLYITYLSRLVKIKDYTFR